MKKIEKKYDEIDKKLALFLAKKDYSQALNYILQMEHSLENIQDKIEKKYVEIRLISWKAFLHYELGDYKKAKRDYKHLISLLLQQPKGAGCDDFTMFNAYLMLGTICLKLKIYKSAICFFETAMSIAIMMPWNIIDCLNGIKNAYNLLGKKVPMKKKYFDSYKKYILSVGGYLPKEHNLKRYKSMDNLINKAYFKKLEIARERTQKLLKEETSRG